MGGVLGATFGTIQTCFEITIFRRIMGALASDNYELLSNNVT